MNRCPECGSEVTSEMKFCAECGTKLDIGQSTVSNNITKGIDTASGGTVESYQDNYVSGNPNSDALTDISRS